jgi:L-ascorbate metabolism protein UlaG (beta-lactamase superfamily)
MNNNFDQENKINKYIYREKNLTPAARVKELVGTFAKSLPMFVSSKKSVKYLQNINLKDWYTPSIPEFSSEILKITWIGHSSFLIQIMGLNILIDPIFFDLMLLYKRVIKPGIDIKNLPKIDFILISHDHADHLDYKSLLELKKFNSKILIPKGTINWFNKNNFINIKEFDWWQDFIFNFKNKIIKFSFLPAVHWSGRKYAQINKSCWGSWMISANNKNIFFAGDTAYDKHFIDIAKDFEIDVALLPIGPVEPRNIVKHSHMDSIEAVKAFIDLNAKNFIPMHWGTFKVNLDNFYLPVKKLYSCWQEHEYNLKTKNLCVLKFGQSIQL